MTYILGTEKAPGCFFCVHPNQEASLREHLVLVVQEHAFVCLNRYPFAAGHILVAPRRHVAELSELEADEYGALMNLLRDSIAAVKSAVGCEGMNVGFNFGKAAGAGVADHLHGHVVPRWNGDTSFMPVVAGARIMPEYLDETWRRLHPAFAGIPGVRAAAPEPA